MRVQKLLPVFYPGRAFHHSEPFIVSCEMSMVVPVLCASQGPWEDRMEKCLVSKSLGKVRSLSPLCRFADWIWGLGGGV